MGYQPWHRNQQSHRIAAGLLSILVSGLGLNSCGRDRAQSTTPLGTSAPTLDESASAQSVEALPPPLEYQTYELPTSLVYTVTVPAHSEYRVAVAMSESLTTLPVQAENAEAIAAINAGFFDPQNGKTTSFITVDGAIVASPQDNDRLIGNPDLQVYLPAILNRSEFRIYDCGGNVQYDITLHDAPVPTHCGLDAAVGAGPQLLPTMTGYSEGFMADNASGERVRDALGSQTANARSAIGFKADGTVVLAMASQFAIADAPPGVTLTEMADFLADLGVVKALNLDGGSSSSLYFEGETYFGRLDADGSPIQRPIKSILYVTQSQK